MSTFSARHVLKPGGLGTLALVAAAMSVILGPPSWFTLASTAAATLLFARDARIGWLGAGLLVMIAIPYGRGADVVQFEVAELPVRPADIAIGIALAGAAVTVRPTSFAVLTPARRATTVAIGLLLITGLLALGIGVLEAHWLRDLVRDARFWFLYVVGLLVLFSPAPSAGIVRALLIGATVFSSVVLLATALPVVADGLKDQALTYDRGTLRMQFGNSIFLLPAFAFILWRFLHRPSIVRTGWLLTLIAAIFLSLTRMSIFAALLIAVIVIGTWAWQRGRRGGLRILVTRGLASVGTIGLGVALALSMAVMAQASGTSPAGGGLWPDPGQSGSPENIIDRLTGQSEQSDLDATLTSRTGRIATYAAAYSLIMEHFPLGAGLGQLIPTAFAYSEARATTIGHQPGVDNTYLTFGVKAGVLGMALIAALMLLPLLVLARTGPVRMRGWFVPAWIGILALTLTQGFASSGYGPYGIAVLVALPALRARRSGRH